MRDFDWTPEQIGNAMVAYHRAMQAGKLPSEAWAAALTAAQPVTMRDDLERLASKWERIGREHGVRQFTGNDHLLFANELRAFLAQQSAAPVVPEGWVLVPIKATPAMLNAFPSNFGAAMRYAELIAAAPKLEAQKP